jgi:hypothetical protein
MYKTEKLEGIGKLFEVFREIALIYVKTERTGKVILDLPGFLIFYS